MYKEECDNEDTVLTGSVADLLQIHLLSSLVPRFSPSLAGRAWERRLAFAHTTNIHSHIKYPHIPTHVKVLVGGERGLCTQQFWKYHLDSHSGDSWLCLNSLYSAKTVSYQSLCYLNCREITNTHNSICLHWKWILFIELTSIHLFSSKTDIHQVPVLNVLVF